IHLLKVLGLKILGSVLQARDATNTYIFVVFTSNKVLGILLLPFILGLAFTRGDLHEVFHTSCMLVTGGLFVYRYYLSFVSVH
ncbi:DUF4271 domain-containing protein, partial [Staphylococcus aureus]|uniref:DUF4271 domain-containing protein n=1 Tax=Staphylococcus aureus TaxID=1280 RepID=UPI001E388993